MEFTFSTLMSGFIFGVLGFYLLKAARQRSNIYWAVIGIILMIAPPLMPNDFLNWGSGIALCGLAYALRHH